MSTARQGYENHLDTKEAKWFAVYIKYKREKIVKRLLEEKGIEAYLPVQTFTRRYTRKVKVVELPLISCHIFVKITQKEYVRVLETENVVKFIQFSRNLLSIPEEEILLMQRVVGEGLAFEIEPAKYNEGDSVEIIGGNLTGIQGKLVAIQGKKQFLVELNHIGYTLRMEIDPQLLRKI